MLKSTAVKAMFDAGAKSFSQEFLPLNFDGAGRLSIEFV
jgi:hypothetical protein